MCVSSAYSMPAVACQHDSALCACDQDVAQHLRFCTGAPQSICSASSAGSGSSALHGCLPAWPWALPCLRMSMRCRGTARAGKAGPSWGGSMLLSTASCCAALRCAHLPCPRQVVIKSEELFMAQRGSSSKSLWPLICVSDILQCLLNHRCSWRGNSGTGTL